MLRGVARSAGELGLEPLRELGEPGVGDRVAVAVAVLVRGGRAVAVGGARELEIRALEVGLLLGELVHGHAGGLDGLAERGRLDPDGAQRVGRDLLHRHAGSVQALGEQLGAGALDEHAGAVVLEQLLCAALAHEPAGLHDQHRVERGAERRDVTGRHEHGAAGGRQLTQQPVQPFPSVDVQPVGRFVDDEHLRIAHERAAELQPLAAAEAELADPPVGVGAEPDALERVGHARRGGAGQPGAEAQVARDGVAGIGHRAERDAHLRRRAFELRVRLAEHGGGAGRGADQPHHHAEQDALAGAARGRSGR